MPSTRSRRSSKMERTGSNHSFPLERTSSKQSLSHTSDGIEELLHLSSETTSITDLEKELLKRRDKLIWSLKDPQIYQEFIVFMNNSKSVSFLFLMNIMYCFFFLPTVIKFQFGKGENIHLWCLGEFILEFIVAVSGWLLYGCMCEESIFRRGANWLLKVSRMKSLEKLTNLLQAIFYLSVTTLRSLDLLQRVIAGQCPTNNVFPSFSCNPGANAGSFPVDSFLYVISVPIHFVCVIRESRIMINITGLAITSISLIMCCIIVRSTQAGIIILFCAISGFLIVLDSYKEGLLFYLLSRQLKKMIESNQRLALQNKATEMRHLIANVAHDLKTPLSSFMTGIDIISADVLECLKKINGTPSSANGNECARVMTKEYLTSMMSGLQSCVTNIRNTNAFMLMTINRCLDYTKASNGLKLVPKNETIDLMETIQMPLQCMTNIQNKMKITLQSYEDQGVCSHIITDRQWLQENLLCLLSNAVKYSGEGEVLIVVSKVTRALDGGGNNYHPASPTKLCYQIEDEIITSDPENYRPPVSVREHPHIPLPPSANSSVPSSTPRFSIRSSQFSVLRGNMQRDPSTLNSNGFEAFQSMRARMSMLNTSKVLPGSFVGAPSTRPMKGGGGGGSFLPVTNSSVHHQLENPADIESQKHIPHSRMSVISTASQITHITTDPISDKSFHEELMFEVIDTGIGVSKDAMKSLFNPFKQTQRLAGGTGLGLYSLAKRIEALKGKYGVHQRVDGKQGSVFWFSIPYRADTVTASLANLTKDEKSDSIGRRESYIEQQPGLMMTQLHGLGINTTAVSPLPTAGVQNACVSPNASNPRREGVRQFSIMIVEDTPSIAKMTSMMLKRQKHQTTVAENGQIALKMLYEDETMIGKYDVVLMDLQMPVMDGLEATRRIRAREKAVEIRDNVPERHQIVIGVSANSDYETMEEAFNAGIDDFLPKPFSIDAFVKAVNAVKERMEKHE